MLAVGARDPVKLGEADQLRASPAAAPKVTAAAAGQHAAPAGALHHLPVHPTPPPSPNSSPRHGLPHNHRWAHQVRGVRGGSGGGGGPELHRPAGPAPCLTQDGGAGGGEQEAGQETGTATILSAASLVSQLISTPRHNQSD